MAKHGLVWQAFSKGSELTERFYITDRPSGYLPFFLYGEDYEKMQKKEHVLLNEYMLLTGIMMGWKDTWAKNIDEDNKRTMKYLLVILGQGFGFSTIEKLTLSLAAKIREELGSQCAKIILETGLELVTESSKIRSDLISDIWVLVHETGSENAEQFGQCLREIVAFYEQIKPEDIKKDILPLISYYYLTALADLHSDGKMKQEAFSYIRNCEYEQIIEKAEELQKKISADQECINYLQATEYSVNRHHEAGEYLEAVKKAEAMFKRSKNILGPEHPKTLDVMNLLSLCYCDAGNLDKGLKISEELLPLLRKVLGEEHNSTLEAMHGLAVFYYEAGKYNEAIAILEELVPVSKRVRGEETTVAFGIIDLLTKCYYKVGKVAAAEQIEKKLFKQKESIFGTESPKQNEKIESLILHYSETGRLEEALRQAINLLKQRIETFGENHPKTIIAAQILGLSCLRANLTEQAIDIMKNVVETSSEVLGGKHPDTVLRMGILANCYINAKDYESAARLPVDLLPVMKRLLKQAYLSQSGNSLDIFLADMRTLANCYTSIGKHFEATQMLEEVQKWGRLEK